MASTEQMEVSKALDIIMESLREAGISFDEILPNLESRVNGH
jgi:hypothetical protein